MEIKYRFVLWIGAAVLAGMLAVLFIKVRGNTSYGGGKKIADMVYVKSSPYYRRRRRLYKLYSCCAAALCMLTVGSGFFMMSRPYMTERVQDERYCRDIILCIDISTSVDALNESLMDELVDMVDQLQNERFGIVIFNTSPVYLLPLTDDYEYVKEELKLISTCLDSRNDIWNYFSYDDEWLYYYEYISAGTIVGNKQRGSSLIGDGLASAAYDFSDNDKDKDRTKIIIFSSDNALEGEPLVTLDKAADVCVEKGVTVYGIGTKEMLSEDEASMKEAVEKTGGTFYLEEASGSMDKIVSSIQQQSKGLVKTDSRVVENAKLTLPFLLMLIAYAGMMIAQKVLKM